MTTTILQSSYLLLIKFLLCWYIVDNTLQCSRSLARAANYAMTRIRMRRSHTADAAKDRSQDQDARSQDTSHNVSFSYMYHIDTQDYGINW